MKMIILRPASLMNYSNASFQYWIQVGKHCNRCLQMQINNRDNSMYIVRSVNARRLMSLILMND